MISYLSSVFKETRDSPLEETYFDKSRGSERSVELIECFQLLISMLNKLSEDERKTPQIKTRDELLVDDKATRFQSIFGKIINILEEESEWWAVESMHCEDTNSIDVPCADAFIMCQGLRKLCMFASDDSPRGSLPLILSSIASLLLAIKYPLLPHRSIHEPIHRLIFVSIRYDKFLGNVLALSTGLTQLEQKQYQMKIDIGLASLLQAVWIKISENPSLLDSFYREIDSSEGDKEDTNYGEIEFDIVAGVISMIESPHVGTICKECLLRALSLRNPIIDDYIASKTSIMADCVMELSRRYYAALTAVAGSCRRADRHIECNIALPTPICEEDGEAFPKFLPLVLSPFKRLPDSGDVMAGFGAHEANTGVLKEEGINESENDLLAQATSAISSYLFRTPQKGRYPGLPSDIGLDERDCAGMSPSRLQQRSDRAQAIQALTKVLYFCDSILVSSSEMATDTNPSMRDSLIRELRGAFLETVLLPSLQGRLTCIDADEGDERIASAAFLLWRQMVKELSAAPSQKNGALGVFLSFLVGALTAEGESMRTRGSHLSLLDELLSKTRSTSSIIAMSSASMVATILDALSLEDAFELLRERLVSTAIHSQKQVESFTGGRMNEVGSDHDDDDDDDDDDGDNDDKEYGEGTLLDIQPLMHSLLLQSKADTPCAERLRSMVSHLEQEDDLYYILLDADALQTSISRQVSKLASRITNRRELVVRTKDEFFSARDKLGNTLMEFLILRVQEFQEMTFEAKVALSGLVERSICVCLSLVLLGRAGNTALASSALLAAAKIYVAVDAMCSLILRTAQKSGAVSEANIRSVREVLRRGSASGCGLPDNVNESARTLLEATVLIAEMRQEIKSFFIAASQLMKEDVFDSHMGTPDRQVEGVLHADEGDDDDDDDDPILPMELSVLSDIESNSRANDGFRQSVLEHSTKQVNPHLIKNGGGQPRKPSGKPETGAGVECFVSELSELEKGLDSIVSAI